VANYRVSREYEKQTIIQQTEHTQRKQDKRKNTNKQKIKDKAKNANANKMMIPLKEIKAIYMLSSTACGQLQSQYGI
jgi:hypothetical protein